MALITLTTDFGGDSPYVAAMKGIILSLNPHARLIDLSHQIPPQDVRFAAFFLRACIPYFPPEAIHVVVVDPGVGTDRALLYVEVERHRLLAPDNGCWTGLMGQVGQSPLSGKPTVIRLTERFVQPYEQGRQEVPDAAVDVRASALFVASVVPQNEHHGVAQQTVTSAASA